MFLLLTGFQSTLPARGATTRTGTNLSDFQFQSTLPARGATFSDSTDIEQLTNFNPRSPHGERLDSLADSSLQVAISIHAPRTGSDCTFGNAGYVWMEFQSTLPARGATAFSPPDFDPLIISIHAPRTGSDMIATAASVTGSISIHAPRTGSDARRSACRMTSRNFNPRSPHGERHAFSPPDFDPLTISIHAPRTGSDTRSRRPTSTR